MNNKTLIGFVMAVAVVGGIFGAWLMRVPMLGGDFAGGVTPNQLLTANTATGGITPVGSLAFGFGGTAAANQITNVYTAVATYPWTPSSTSPITIGTSTIVLAATTTQISFSAPGFVVGDDCNVYYSGTTSTLLADGTVTAVSGNAVTSTITFFNTSGVAITMGVTSTVTGVTSTVKTTCLATGV